MFCQKCGKEIPDKSTFCLSCGSKILDAERIRASNKVNNIIGLTAIGVVLAGLTLPLYLFRSNHTTQGGTIKEQPNAKLSPTPLPIQSSFRKTFAGKMNNKINIEMDIDKAGNNISGNYHYKIYGIDIPLKGTIDEQGNFVIEEFDKNSNKLGVFRGKLASLSSSNYEYKMEGRWSNASGDKSMDYVLVESTPSARRKNVPYIGMWSNGSGDILNITLKMVRFNEGKPVAYRDITKVSDENSFSLELTSVGKADFFSKYVSLSIDGDTLKTVSYNSYEDLWRGANPQSSATWYREQKTRENNGESLQTPRTSAGLEPEHNIPLPTKIEAASIIQNSDSFKEPRRMALSTGEIVPVANRKVTSVLNIRGDGGKYAEIYFLWQQMPNGVGEQLHLHNVITHATAILRQVGNKWKVDDESLRHALQEAERRLPNY